MFALRRALPHSRLGRGVVVTILGLGLCLSAVAPAAATGAGLAAPGQEEDETPVPRPVATAIRNAMTSLTTVQARLQAHQYVLARTSLQELAANVTLAHDAGMAQIGRPPADPESDDLPGPPSVIAVLALEHQVTLALLSPFNGLRRNGVISALQTTLITAFDDRDAMLNAVVVLPPEGEGTDDYADGMADTIGIYNTEVTSYKAALSQFSLSSAERLILTDALARVRATRTVVKREFGGGE
jgi:hypothetical protein